MANLLGHNNTYTTRHEHVALDVNLTGDTA